MYLAKEKGYEVYAACANTGAFSEEELKQNDENASKLGAVKYMSLDVTREYYEKSLKYMVFGNAVSYTHLLWPIQGDCLRLISYLFYLIVHRILLFIFFILNNSMLQI